jgi:hypothetical protein
MCDNFKHCVKEKALPGRMMTTLMTHTESTTAMQAIKMMNKLNQSMTIKYANK